MRPVIAVVNVLATVYNLELPGIYKEILNYSSWIKFDYIAVVYPGACMDVSAEGSLTLEVLLPILFILVVMAAGVVHAIFKARTFGSKPMKEGLLNGMFLSILVTFVMCPSVSASILGTWDCVGFEEDSQVQSSILYLRTDMTIRCSDDRFVNPRYDSLSSLAFAYLFLWPVFQLSRLSCVPSMNCLLMPLLLDNVRSECQSSTSRC